MNLVFVYNAKSGVFNTLNDIAHKLFSQSKHQCDLCNLTHGYFHAREEWMTFLNGLDANIEFLHHDEYGDKYESKESRLTQELPAIFVKEQGRLKLWIDKNNISKMSSTDELMETIRAAVLRRQAGVENVDNFLSMPA